MDDQYKESIRKALEGFNQNEWVKSIDDLIHEIEVGDCQLRLFPSPVRTTVVGWCKITSPDGLILMETEQMFHGQTVRYRNQPMAGKLRLKEGVTVEDEMIRELNEELGVSIDNLRRELSKGRLKYVSTDLTNTTTGEKSDYPDLPVECTNYRFTWAMPEEYVRDEYIEKDGYKTTIFRWVDPAWM